MNKHLIKLSEIFEWAHNYYVAPTLQIEDMSNINTYDYIQPLICVNVMYMHVSVLHSTIELFTQTHTISNSP